MKPYEAAFAEAYDAILGAEISVVSEEAEAAPHIFSDRFERNMEALILAGRSEKKLARIKRRRTIILIAAAIALLALAACAAIPAVREKIYNFFFNTFDDRIEYTVPDLDGRLIEQEYALEPIPDGFSENFFSHIGTAVTVAYRSETEDRYIQLHVSSKPIEHILDNEHGSYSQCEVGGRRLLVYFREEAAAAVWVENGCLFELFYGGHIEPGEFNKLIASVRSVEPRAAFREEYEPR